MVGPTVVVAKVGLVDTVHNDGLFVTFGVLLSGEKLVALGEGD